MNEPEALDDITPSKLVWASLLAILSGMLVVGFSNSFWGHAADVLVFVGVLAMPTKPFHKKSS